MGNLDTRTKFITGYIRSEDSLPVDKFALLHSYFNTSACRYGISIHDKDIGKDGKLEPLHFHFVADMVSVKRLGTFLNEICEALNVPELSVSIQKYKYFEGAFQYLIHKRDVDKYQYDENIIVHNLCSDEFKLVMTWEPKGFDYSALAEVVVTSASISEVIARVGISYYSSYRWIILDLWKELHCTGLLFDKETNTLKEFK